LSSLRRDVSARSILGDDHRKGEMKVAAQGVRLHTGQT
jgi:hypothetical protein